MSRPVIFSSSRGWHENRLIQAFHHHRIDPAVVSLSDCGFSHGNKFGGLRIPEFDDELPSVAFVRGISAGTFEQVTFRLGILHALSQMSINVVNSAKTIERTVDKSMTSHLLDRHAIPNVPSWSCESTATARHFLESELSAGHKVVVKPLFGSQGRGLQLLSKQDELPELEELNGVYYMQRYVPPKSDDWRDWRIFVVGGRAICAMERRSTNWVTNKAQGAQCIAAQLNSEVFELAQRAAAAVGANYAGVDIIKTLKDEWQILEVNGAPAWQGIQAVSDVDIASEIVDYLLKFVD